MLPYGSSERERAGSPVRSFLAPGGVYIAPRRRFAGELLPRLSILTLAGGCGRYFSVALSLESPPQAVNLHPCPAVLGLSSYCYAAVRLSRVTIKPQKSREIKKNAPRARETPEKAQKARQNPTSGEQNAPAVCGGVRFGLRKCPQLRDNNGNSVKVYMA